MTPIQFSVTNGPGKFDLSNALFAYNPRRPASFTSNCPVNTVLEICITSVQSEDDSGESWNIEGTVLSVSRDKRFAGFYLPEVGQRVFICFRTDRRQGHIRFFEKKVPPNLEEIDEIVRRTNEKQFGDGTPVRR